MIARLLDHICLLPLPASIYTLVLLNLNFVVVVAAAVFTLKIVPVSLVGEAVAAAGAMEADSDAAEGEPEPDVPYLVRHNLDAIIYTMAKALRERESSMTTLQMAKVIPGSNGYPSTNLSSLSVVKYIIENHYQELEDGDAYFLGGSFYP